MPKKEEVNKLLSSMKGAIPKEKGQASHCDSLHRKIDLGPYKEHHAWPGKSYLLIGNSYNPAMKPRASKAHKARREAVEQLLARGGGQPIKLSDALKNKQFVQNLSRFEYDWLRREKGSTLVGAAYNGRGEVLHEEFAVWRKEALVSAAPSAQKATGANSTRGGAKAKASPKRQLAKAGR